MVAFQLHKANDREEEIAHLTQAAYHAVLARGFRGSFLDLELSLWSAIREAVEQDADRELAVNESA